MTTGDEHHYTPHPFHQSVGFAMQGVSYALCTERNMRVHFCAAYTVLLFELVVRPQFGITVFTALTCYIVIAAELLNTSIERLTDLATQGQRHPVAKYVKDASSGAVLMLSVASIFVAGFVLIATYPWRFRLFTGVHPAGAVVVICSILILSGLVVSALRVRGGHHRGP